MSDVIVIGGGPAGMSAAIYAVRAGSQVMVLKGSASALEKAEMIENYYGFPEPISGAELQKRGEEQAKRLGVTIEEGQVVGLTWEDQLKVTTTDHTYEAGAVILATGTPRREPKIQGFQRLDGMGISWCAICDGFFCRGQDVAVLGAGEYAVHEAEILLPIARSVTLLTNGEEPEVSLPANLILETEKVTALEGENGLEQIVLQDGRKLPIAKLFVALGVAGSSDLARKVGAFLEGNRIKVDEEMSTNVPGLFAAGDCTVGMLQVAKAVWQGAQAGLSAAKYVRQKRAAASSSN